MLLCYRCRRDETGIHDTARRGTLDGPLAAACLDYPFYLWRGFCTVPAAVLAGVCLCAGLVFSLSGMGLDERRRPCQGKPGPAFVGETDSDWPAAPSGLLGPTFRSRSVRSWRPKLRRSMVAVSRVAGRIPASTKPPGGDEKSKWAALAARAAVAARHAAGRQRRGFHGGASPGEGSGIATRGPCWDDPRCGRPGYAVWASTSPRACLPLGPLSGRTLFQILLEQLLAVSASIWRAHSALCDDQPGHRRHNAAVP